MKKLLTSTVLWLLALMMAESLWGGSTYYVAVTGNNAASGSITTPWRTVNYGLSRLNPGDTLIIRGGTYRESDYHFVRSGSEGNPITIKGYPGETVIVSGGQDGSGISKWTRPDPISYPNVWEWTPPASGPYRILTQNDKPLQLAIAGDNFSGSYTNVNAEGRWSRNRDTNKIWVWAYGGGNPGQHSIEASYAYDVLITDITTHYIIFENLTVECGNNLITIGGDHSVIRNCTLRNAYQNCVKVQGCQGYIEIFDSQYNLVENCDIYYFGECGIDCTGGDYWTFRNNTIHHASPNHYYGSYGGWHAAPLHIKNGSQWNLAEGNRFFNNTNIFWHRIHRRIDIGPRRTGLREPGFS